MNMKNISRGIALLLVCTLVLSMNVGLALATGTYGTATINGWNSNRVHLRVGSSEDAASLGLYFTGTTVQCESDPSALWVKVIIGTQMGYMKSAYLDRGKYIVQSQEPIGKVTTSAVNLREAASLERNVVSQLMSNDLVTVHGETVGGWYYVTAGALSGYVMSEYVSLDASEVSSSMNISNTVIINGGSSDRVHLREGKTASSKSLGLYYSGTEVTCLSGKDDPWVEVQIGQECGYMSAEYLNFGSSNVKSQHPTATVRQKSSGYINVRLIPYIKSEIIATLNSGDSITILGETANGWYYMQSGDMYGYVLTNLVTLDGGVAIGETWVDMGYRM